MQIFRFPPRDQWDNITKRPVWDFADIEAKIIPILHAVKQEGDVALKRYTALFDRVELNELQVNEHEWQPASAAIDQELQTAIKVAITNITTFHKSQLEEVKRIETVPGVTCWRKSVPIERVGLYIPGGTAPLFSTVLMLGIPAKIAGCAEVVLCSPPDRQGQIHPTLLYAAQRLGCSQVFKIGGAQAIAALAYGTESVPKVDKIFGPGNQFVTAAKQLVNKEGIAIDLPAGPSEVAVLADKSADPDFIAADLLSQAEHGTDSQVVLVTDHPPLIEHVSQAITAQITRLPRQTIAQAALEHSKLIVLHDFAEALDLVNLYAPEHLILMVNDPEMLADKIVNAGSVFLGAYTPEAAGDYASGTNHTLPTNGFARAYSGVSLDSFMKKITFQKIEPAGLRTIGPAVEGMAAAEGLEAHKQAVRIRLNKLRS